MDFKSSTSTDSEKTEVSIELRVANIGSEPIQIVRIDNIVLETTHIIDAPTNARVAGGSVFPARKNTAPMNVEIFHLKLDAGKGPVIVKPKVVYADEKGRERSYEVQAQVIASSSMLDYLVKEFITDYANRQLAPDHSGWRTLTTIGGEVGIPRSQLYGEPRWGREYGRPLEALVRSGVVECRRFPGERGRGGQILKVRFAHQTEIAKRYLEETGQAPARHQAPAFPLRDSVPS